MKKIKTILILIIIAILGLSFYWFEWRPTQIRQRCFAEAEFDKRATLEFNDAVRQEFIDTYYKNCLKRFGLEK